MQCSEIRELLSAYIDGVLDTNENTAVKEHLRTCSACSRNLADLQETIRLLRSLGDIRPPEGFRQELRGKLEKEPPPAGSIKNLFWAPKARRWISGPGKYLAASFIIIGLGLSTGIYNLLQSGMLPKSVSYDLALEQKAESGTDRVVLESAPQKGKEKSIAEIPAGESDMASSTAGNPQVEQNEGFIAGAQEGVSQDSSTTQLQQPFMKSSEVLITAVETPEAGTTTSEAYPKSPEESAGSVLTTPNYDSGASKNSEKPDNVSEDAAVSNNSITGEVYREAAKDSFLSIEISNYEEFEPVPEKSAARWLLPIALIIAGIGGVIYHFRIR